MLTKTPFTANISDIHNIVNIQKIKDLASFSNLKTALTVNEPTGRFFYEPWDIKTEFKGTAIEKVLQHLSNIGEARIIALPPGQCYRSHADIDDRYHLNLQGQRSYLVDLDESKMFPTEVDGNWYIMDTGKIHSAVNFGSITRLQLVVRHLLQKNNLKTPIRVVVCQSGDGEKEKSRFIFDDVLSPWLNQANKNNIIDNVSAETAEQVICFDIEEDLLSRFQKLIPTEFQIKFL